MSISVLDVGDESPDFNLDSQLGPISFHSLIEGKWGLVFTFHKAFDPVSTTDIGMICKLFDEFEGRNISVLGIGSDTVAIYRKWIRDIEELQEVKVNIPLVSDPDNGVLLKLGCSKISPFGQNEIIPSSCGLFLIDVDKRIRSSMRYSLNMGRNIYEVIRTFDALQIITYNSVVCPSNWCMGQDVMINNEMSNDEASKSFPKGYVEIRPWFRLTPCPEQL